MQTHSQPHNRTGKGHLSGPFSQVSGLTQKAFSASGPLRFPSGLTPSPKQHCWPLFIQDPLAGDTFPSEKEAGLGPSVAAPTSSIFGPYFFLLSFCKTPTLKATSGLMLSPPRAERVSSPRARSAPGGSRACAGGWSRPPRSAACFWRQRLNRSVRLGRQRP